MSVNRHSATFVAFTFVPLFIFLLLGEIAVRIRYYMQSGDRAYLTTIYDRRAFAPVALPTENPRMPQRADGQMVFAWESPCTNTMVFSTELQKMMPRTYDENCFRGDRVTEAKQPGEFRILWLGGSAVEDRQSDAEMMTTQFKNGLRLDVSGPVTVVNAGHAAFDAMHILELYKNRAARLSPDLVLFYEAGNELPVQDRRFRDAERALIDRLGSSVHQALYYRSMLYTYAVEKYELTRSGRNQLAFVKRSMFWKVDLSPLRKNFTALVQRVRADRGRFVFVTEASNWPRVWKGVDTFDENAVGALIDRLKADPGYTYDLKEITALNERLIVDYNVRLCRELNVPVIDLLEPIEALGDGARSALFIDLAHRTIQGNRVVGELVARRLESVLVGRTSDAK